jgi:Domain of unknown function (DUF5060)
MTPLRGHALLSCLLLFLAGGSLGAQPSITVSQSAPAVARYDVLELTLAEGSSYTNPWEDVSVSASFTGPSGASVAVGGFYYDVGTWKVRFAPNQAGAWNWSLTFKNASGQTATSGTFTCTASANTGFLRLHPANPYRFMTEGDNRPFYPLGFDSGIPQDGDYRIGDTAAGKVDMNQFFDTYAAAGNNIFRLLINSNTTPILSQSLNVSGTGKNTYSVANGQAIDAVVAKLHQDGYKIYMVVWGSAPNFGSLAAPGAAQSALSYHKYVVDRYGAYVDVWELMNEQNSVPAEYYNTVIPFLRTYDPYHHLLSTSDPQPAMNLDVDITSPHRYFNAYNASLGGLDPGAGYLADDIAKWKAAIPNKPIVYGEAGIQDPYNYDPTGYRIWLWTGFFNEAGLIFWNTSYEKTYVTNQYLGSEERAFSRIHSGYVADFDGAAAAADVTVSKPSALRAYALAGANDVAVYFLSWNFTSALSGETVMLNFPADGMQGEWFDPSTGNVLSTFPIARGTQTLTIPSFMIDLVLRLRGSGQSSSGCTNPQTIPSGFTAPCPVLEVTPSQASASGALTISASSPAGAAARVLSTFYLFDAGQWIPVTVPGAPGWCSAGCSVTLPAGSLTALSPGSYAVSSWEWTWNGSCWVGPGSNGCNQGSWRYQTFTVR